MSEALNTSTAAAEAAPAPAGDAAAATTTTAAETTSEAQTSPSGSDTGTAAEAPAAVEGDAEAAAALAVVPETADGYQLKISDAAKTTLGSLDGDPVFGALREAAKEKGWTQGQFNERVGETIDMLAEKGLLVPNFDPAAELGKLSEGGKDGKARQQEVQVFADSLKARGDINDEQYGELMSLVPTAAGVQLVEMFRAMSATGGTAALPGGDPAAAVQALKAEASEMRRDERYDKDPVFKAQADKKYKEAWGAK